MNSLIQAERVMSVALLKHKQSLAALAFKEVARKCSSEESLISNVNYPIKISCNSLALSWKTHTLKVLFKFTFPGIAGSGVMIRGGGAEEEREILRWNQITDNRC